ncbi:MAG: DNA polymerase III subunit gamma/tau [Chloroflexota bacterium]|jgi:DNA polymerase-3 subunit gamma/tau
MQPQKEARSLYHRWRSQCFEEVVGQDHVTRTLKNAVANGKVVHAYLFCGPRGTGKTSSARILAKAVNCLDPKDGEPCNRCASCIAVNEGRAMDLIEIDAASNRGIDDARDLREKIKFAPGESRYKVYIIDEAHMLTSEASNALLKTLEEPPDHAIIVLATTESHKILPTISSRCQRFDFRRIPLQTIIRQLEMICQGEGLKVEKAVLERVARMARGSLRDAESLLDQLVAYCGEQISLTSAREILGLTGEETVPELADALRKKDLAEGLRLIDRASSVGADLRHLSRELVEYLRALMVAKSGADTTLLQGFQGDELARLRSQSEAWGYQQLVSALKVFTDLEGKMRTEPFNQLHLEIAFMEAALSHQGVDSADLERRCEDSRSEYGKAASTAQESHAAHPVTEGPIAAQSVAVKDAGTSEVAESKKAGDSAKEESKTPLAISTLDIDSLKREWPRIADGFPKVGIGIAVAGCRPIRVSGNRVVLGSEGAAFKQLLERPNVKKSVEERLGSVFGKRVSVQFEFGVKLGMEKKGSRDAVVEAAVREFGFRVAREEKISE